LEKKKRAKPPVHLRRRKTIRLILSAAREIFVEEGYTKTSMVMIGERATVGYNTIYCYFNGKNKVMTGVVDQFLIDLYERARL
jgi:AcrR family transcriptional regulator